MMDLRANLSPNTWWLESINFKLRHVNSEVWCTVTLHIRCLQRTRHVTLHRWCYQTPPGWSVVNRWSQQLRYHPSFPGRSQQLSDELAIGCKQAGGTWRHGILTPSRNKKFSVIACVEPPWMRSWSYNHGKLNLITWLNWPLTTRVSCKLLSGDAHPNRKKKHDTMPKEVPELRRSTSSSIKYGSSPQSNSPPPSPAM